MNHLAMKAVVVDDSRPNLLLVEAMAKTIGLEVSSFINPVEALAHVRKHGADMILTDYSMPQMDGITLLKEIRRTHKDVPIIMITAADNDTSLELDALESGVTDFLTKPINTAKFTAKVKNLATLRHYQRLHGDRAALLEDEVRTATNVIVERELETLQILGKAAEFRDPNTRNHEERIGKYTRLIAKSLGLDEEEQNLICQASQLHDIGKIGIPDNILLKPGRLTQEETEVVRSHAIIGYNILKDRKSHYLKAAATIALTHHEKFDGSGYPSGLSSGNIPLWGRITAIADVFDVLTSKRSYKEPWSLDDAITYLADNKNSHFDPELVDLFIESDCGIITIESGKAVLSMPEPPWLKYAPRVGSLE
ncbi:MAG: HD domain-containing phosphohydrolase [Dissulfurispiraceae bacterium]